MIKDDLGNRMKEFYEFPYKFKLTRRIPVIIRLDGKAFHTFTKGFKKPFDRNFNYLMQNVALNLCKNIQGCKLAYCQSDEISLLLTDYDTIETSAWFDYEVQKLCSVSASIATATMIHRIEEDYVKNLFIPKDHYFVKALQSKALPLFDSRGFNLPKEEVANYFYWRQVDAERNSVNALAQSFFKQKELQGLNLKGTIEKVKSEKGIDWNELETIQKRGFCIIKDEEGKWITDSNIPRFIGNDRKYIERFVFLGEGE